LTDKDWRGRASAAAALGFLGATETVPELLTLLADKVAVVRGISAASLCLLGSQEGVAILLREAQLPQAISLSSLNALRQPEAWARLGRKPLGRNVGGEDKQVVDLLREAGIAVEVSREQERMKDPYQGRTVWGGWASALEGLMTGRYEFILEPDRIRILTRWEAQEYWERWEQGQKRK
jgi:hypothetical protein